MGDIGGGGDRCCGGCGREEGRGEGRGVVGLWGMREKGRGRMLWGI